MLASLLFVCGLVLHLLEKKAAVNSGSSNRASDGELPFHAKRSAAAVADRGKAVTCVPVVTNAR